MAIRTVNLAKDSCNLQRGIRLEGMYSASHKSSIPRVPGTRLEAAHVIQLADGEHKPLVVGVAWEWEIDELLFRLDRKIGESAKPENKNELPVRELARICKMTKT